MQPDDFYIDTDWPDPYDTSGEQCAYLYCGVQDGSCSWRSEICGLDLMMIRQAAERHIERAHSG